MPQRGLGDDYINEIYELDAPSSFSRRPSSGIRNQPNRAADINSSFNRVNNNGNSFDRVASIPSPSTSNKDQESTADDLKNIVKALGGLIQLLNSTNKGRPKPVVGYQKNPGIGHLGNKRYPVKNIIFDDEATFSNVKSHNLPEGDIIYFNLKKNLPKPLVNSPSQVAHTYELESDLPVSSTIPPHLIPLGPDGSPLVKPDGSYVDPGRTGDNSKLSHMFPYLSEIKLFTTVPTTTTSPATLSVEFPYYNQSETIRNQNVNVTEVDNRDMFTKTIDMINDMPMDTKRHMLANMMVGVPMAAITMAAAGLPPLGIISEKSFLTSSFRFYQHFMFFS